MSVNLVIWSWSDEFNSPAKRKKNKVKFNQIQEVWCEAGDHPCMARVDFSAFEAAIVQQIGPEVVDGPYILERYPKSLCFNLPSRQAPKLIPIIGKTAREFGLNAMEF